MSLQHLNAIGNRLSLRPPQRDSLEILAGVCEIVSLAKDGDTAQALETIKTEFPSVEEFERGVRAAQQCRQRTNPDQRGRRQKHRL